MRRHRTQRQQVFSPLRDKTLVNVLRQLFANEFDFEKKMIFADAMILRILETLEAFLKPVTLLRPGQMLWMAVINDGRKHAHRPMTDIPQVPVVLDLVADEDLHALAHGESYPAVRRRRQARLLQQAFAAGGVLAQGDLAAITLVSNCQISRDISRSQRDEGRPLPYRGSVQDAGGAISHRVEVARLLEAGYLEPEICRRLSPVHDLSSVENYAQTYKNVLKLLDHGFAPTEISGILRVGQRLVDAYIEIVRKHHPEIGDYGLCSPGQADSPAHTLPRGHMTQM
jgi:hypothetical protein